MDISPVRGSNAYSGDTDDSDDSDMAYDGATVQGDYVPPEANSSPDPVRLRRTVATRPPQRGGAVRPDSPTEVLVEVRGNLQKMGKRLKGWHIRYFEIQGTHMYYYKNHMKKECLGEINLSKCFFCDATSAATFGHAFEVRTTERTHILAARSKEEMVQWVRVVRKNKGISEQESGAKKSKPKRWESFKQALAIRPASTASKPPIPPGATAKKQNKKSIKDKFRINRSKDRGTSPTPPQGDAHTPITQREPSHLEAHSTRPMSLTENDYQQDTLEILASLQPTRSLPSTPLVAKRPVNFNESPTDSPTFLRKTAGSPALTIDSTMSTPTHSATPSPAHSPAKKTEESKNTEEAPIEDESILIKKETVEIETHPLSETQATPGTPTVIIKEPSPPPIQNIPEDSALPIEAHTSTEQNNLEIEQNEEVTVKPLPSKPKVLIPVEPPPAPLPEFMSKKFTWDEIRDVLDSNEDEPTVDYNGILPPEDPVWLEKPTSVEQLRVFLLSCP